MATTSSVLLGRAASVYLPGGMSDAEKETLAFRINEGHTTSVEALNSIAMSANRINGEADELARLFFLVFNRPPDLATFQVGISALGQGMSLGAICNVIINLGASVFGASQTNLAFVDTLARQMFTNPSSVVGLSFVKADLVAQLNNGTLSRVALLEGVSRLSSATIKYEESVEAALAMLVGAGREATSEDLYSLKGQSSMGMMRTALTLGGESPYGTKPYFSISADTLSVSNVLSETLTFNLQLGSVSNADSSAFSLIVSRDGGLTESPITYKAGVISGVANINLAQASGEGLNHVVYANNAGSTIVGPDVASSLYGGSGVDVITGGLGADTITGGDGADRLTGGEGADTITGGDGADQIDLTEVIVAADTVKLGSIAASADTITSCATGSDKIDLSQALSAATLTIDAQIEYSTVKATNIAAVTLAADTDAPVYYIANTAGGSGVMTLAEIEAAIVAGSAATGEAVILIDDGASTRIYVDLQAESSPAAGVGTGLTLVGTLSGITGVSALATGDLISV